MRECHKMYLHQSTNNNTIGVLRWIFIIDMNFYSRFIIIYLHVLQNNRNYRLRMLQLTKKNIAFSIIL